LRRTLKEAEYGQGGGGTDSPLKKIRKPFVINILTCNPLRLKILRTIFVKPAPVAAFQKGVGGGGVPITTKATQAFPKRNCLASLRSSFAANFFAKFPQTKLAPIALGSARLGLRCAEKVTSVYAR
jgi:hypothetical protein